MWNARPTTRSWSMIFYNTEWEENAYDWYCVFCGGPFRYIVIRPWEKNDPFACYDTKIIRKKDIRWTEDMWTLGFNEEATGPTRCFLAPSKLWWDIATLDPQTPETCDPNYPGRDPMKDSSHPTWELELQLSANDEAMDLNFALHGSCMELFCLATTGQSNFFENRALLDKDALYLALQHCKKSMARLRNYRYTREFRDHYWDSVRGWEVLVADPTLPRAPAHPAASNDNDNDNNNDSDNPVTAYLRTLISLGHSSRGAGRALLINPYKAAKLTRKVRADPFGALPLELLCLVTDHLGTRDVLRLCRASWTTHSLLRASNRFWRRRVARVSLPWLGPLELAPLLADGELMAGVDMRALLGVLERITKHREDMRGPLMGVANRRRIYEGCERIAPVYWRMVRDLGRVGIEDVFEKVMGRQPYYEQPPMPDGYDD